MHHRSITIFAVVLVVSLVGGSCCKYRGAPEYSGTRVRGLITIQESKHVPNILPSEFNAKNSLPVGFSAVYISRTNSKTNGKTLLPVKLKLGKQGYSPQIAVLQTGQLLEIDLDGSHYVHPMNLEHSSFGHAFDSTTTFRTRFTEPEVFTVLTCDVHPQERAYLVLIDHRDVTIANADGTFELPYLLPKGQYEINVEHPACKKISKEFTVTGAGVSNVDFVIQTN